MAAKKKDFNTENIGRVYNTIADATAEEPAAIKAPAKEMPRRNRNTPPTADDIQEAREQGKTQGRKGCKAIRINMAFTPEVYNYILKKEREGKSKKLAKIAGLNKFLRIYYARVKEVYQ